jgi:hypothetical protein
MSILQTETIDWSLHVPLQSSRQSPQFFRWLIILFRLWTLVPLSLLLNQMYFHCCIIFNLHHAQKLQLQRKVTVFESLAKETWVHCPTCFFLITFDKIAHLYHNCAISIILLPLLNLMYTSTSITGDRLEWT